MTPIAVPPGLLAELDRGPKLVLSMSGGKDSTAMALALREAGYDDFRAVFMDTGWEHPETYRYVREVLPSVIGRPVTELRAVVEVPERYREEVEAIEALLGWVHAVGPLRHRIRDSATPASTPPAHPPGSAHAPPPTSQDDPTGA